MKKTISFLFIVSLSLSSVARAGGGGCGGDCPPAHPSQVLRTCQITEMVDSQNPPTGQHRSFRTAQSLFDQFQVGQILQLQGGEYERQPTAVYFATLHSSPETQFSYYSSVNPPVTDAGVENTRLYLSITGGMGAKDFPLIHYAFLDFSLQNANGTFSLIWEYDSSFYEHKEIVALVGKMICR